MYAKAIVKYHITTVAAFSKFANISVIEAKQYFVIFEQKGIIKKEKNQTRIIEVTLDDINVIYKKKQLQTT